MNNRVITGIIALLLTLTVAAHERTDAEMLTIAKAKLSKTLSAKRQKSVSPQPLTLKTVREDSQYRMYVAEDNSGYVIVARNEAFRPIIGYSTEPTTTSEIPCCMQACLDIINANLEARLESAETEEATGTDGTTYEVVSPLLKTYWTQRSPYNLLCPKDYTGNTSLTGCVATAMAMVMNYFKYPASVEGKSGSYTVKQDESGTAGEKVEVTINSTYQWDLMQNTYTSTSGTTEQRNAVAQLMFDCGCAVGMKYGYSGSSASTKTAGRNYYDTFGYAAANIANKDYYTDYEWRQLVYDQIMAGCPLQHGGTDSARDSGHSFVFDGIDSEGNVHVNWGWGSSNHGYFDILALTPKNGSTNCNFDTALSFVFGLKAKAALDEGEMPVYQIVTGYGTGNNKDGYHTISIKENKVILNMWNPTNVGPVQFNGYLGVRYEGQNGAPTYNVKLKSPTGGTYKALALNYATTANYNSNNVPSIELDRDETPSSISPGKYKVYLCSYNTDMKNPHPVRQRYEGAIYWILTVDEDGTLSLSSKVIPTSGNPEVIDPLKVGDVFSKALGENGQLNYEVITASEPGSVGTVRLLGYSGSDALTTIPDAYTSEITATDNLSYQVTEIADNAFKNQTSLTTVGNAPNLKRIGASAFEGCTSLTTLSTGMAAAGLNYFGDRAFYGCTSLIQLGTISNVILFGKKDNTGGIINVGKEAFKGCTSIQRFSNNGNVTTMGESAFEGCTSLGTHKDGAFYTTWAVTSIPEKAFKDCSSLGNIIFSSATEVGNQAFSGIPETATVTLPYQLLSDELMSNQGLAATQLKGYIRFSATDGYIRVISCKKPLNIAYTSVTVKYVSNVTETSDGVTVETTNTPTKAVPSNGAVIAQYTDESKTSVYLSASILTKEPDAYENYLIPCTEATTLSASDATDSYYTFAPTDRYDFNTFTKVTAAKEIAAGTAYMKLKDGKAVPTGIKSLFETPKTGIKYNLNGQRVGSDYKGIVIVNGRKVLQK